MAAFPTQVAGQPVTGYANSPFIAFVCAFGGQEGLDNYDLAPVPGVNLATAILGAASVPIDPDAQTVTIYGYRFPGGDANLVAQNFEVLQAANTTSSPEPGTLTTQTVGGKNVYVWTTVDGNVTYLYPRGDILMGTDTASPDRAEILFAALP
jgi:hypothetical protein